MVSASKRILFISNGHGEDNHSSYVIRTLRQLAPELDIAALAIVGQGKAYRNLKVPLIGPTQDVPSGGFTYMNRLLLLKDIQAGLLGLTRRQFQAMRHYAPSCDLIMATGDTISQSFAYLSGRPFVSFISCLSSLYEGRLNLDLLLKFYFASPRCLAVFTRDPYTAEDLSKQGIKKVKFGGIPSLDHLVPTGKDLGLNPAVPMLALLPGSRLPEAVRNFQLQLDWVREIAQLFPPQAIQFRAALVPGLMTQLGEIADTKGWHYQEGKLSSTLPDGSVEVGCYSDAFSDILHACTLVLGMAGLAVDQAVGLGKPVIQVAGQGPQFTYAFAEAQDRLLGLSAQTIGDRPATPEILRQAAQCVVKTLQDQAYLQACQQEGRDRLGRLGASDRMAQFLLSALNHHRLP